ncbi:MAG: hypothetical protein ACKPJQ_19425, partial [Dolichospermum sp.]
MTKSVTHDVEEIQSELCILHGVGDFKAFCWLFSNVFCLNQDFQDLRIFRMRLIIYIYIVKV